MSGVDYNGFHCDDLGTIYANLQAAMIAIFGPDIDLDPDTLDGQTLGIYAESKADSDSLAQDVYNSFNPQTATGVALSRVVEYNGIRRIPAIASQATVTCSGTSGTHIPINSVIACSLNGEQFVTIQDGIIDDTGAIDIAVLSVNVGAIQAPAHTLTAIVTPVFGWQGVTNALTALVGRDEESDEELRIRRAQSTATPAQSVPDSVYGAIANIPEVTQVRLYENYEEVADPVTGLPPHSFSAVVEGGLDQDIGDAIWNRASLGATQVGTTQVTVTDIQGFTHTIKFQRPTNVRIYIAISLHPLTGWGDQLLSQIVASLVDYSILNWKIGASIIYSRLYEPINQLPNTFSVTALHVGTTTPPSGTVDIAIPYASIAKLDPADVVITKV
jgi:uncharacterized phage protein gp47/JayE